MSAAKFTIVSALMSETLLTSEKGSKSCWSAVHTINYWMKCLGSRLRMSGAIHLLPLHAFITWKGQLYLYWKEYTQPTKEHECVCIITHKHVPAYKHTYIQDVRKRLYLFKKFCFLVSAILKILCIWERRVFQSKLGVSSSNQCNLHHSPHTGHLGK